MTSLKKLYNFGASQAHGYGYEKNDHAFFYKISEISKYEPVDFSIPGTGLEYSILKLFSVLDQLNSEDLVCFQIIAHPDAVLKINDQDEMINIYGVSQILNMYGDYGKGMQEAYGTGVFNYSDFSLHYGIHLLLLVELLKNLPCKSFVYFCNDLPEKFLTDFLKETLHKVLASGYIEKNNSFSSFVESHSIDSRSQDGKHISKHGHQLWADYIIKKLDL